MTFTQLHENTQQEIRRIEAKRRTRDQAIADKASDMRIVGFANPLHDALFKLAVMGIRHIEKNGFPKITIKVK